MMMLQLKTVLLNSAIALVLVLMLYSANLSSQELDLSFETKDYQGLETSLLSRLENNKNYIISFSAFWCQPCVRNINEIYSKNIEKYREEYNLEIIILDYNNFDNPRIALNKMRQNQWYFDMYFVENRYTSFGVYSIPAYFFKPANSPKAERLPNNNFERAIDQYYANQNQSSLFNKRVSQTVVDNDCEAELYEFGIEADTLIDNLEYFKISNDYYRSGTQSNSIYRLNPTTQKSVVLFDMTLDVCDEYVLYDFEQDSIIITIESISKGNGYLELITDANLVETCTNSTIPFIISEAYGSNAGIHFDIENGEIITTLACQSNNSNIIYAEPKLLSSCISSNLVDLNSSTLVKITPNPASKKLLIESNLSFKHYEIYNQLGQLSGNGVLDYSKEIDIETLSIGSYYLKLKDELGVSSVTKFIKM